MKIKNLFLTLGLVSIAFLTSCTKENFDKPSLLNQSANEETNKTNGLRSAEVGEGISSIDLSNEDVRLVYEKISLARQNGHDDKIPLAELIEENHLRTASENSLARKIKDSLTKGCHNSFRSASDSLDLTTLLAKENMSIYWPNREDWDGETPPTVAYVPEELENSKDMDAAIPAFNVVKDGRVLEKALIEESYTDEHPLWIISREPNNSSSQANPPVRFGDTSIHLPIYDWSKFFKEKITVVRLGKFQATKYYDPWFKGGPEFRLNVVYPFVTKDENGNNKIEFFKQEYPINLSRSDVEKDRIFDLNLPIVPEFQKAIDYLGIYFYEEDFEFLDHKRPVEFEASYKGVTAKTKFYISSQHDFIFRQIFTKNFLRSDANYDVEKKEWIWHHFGGVHFTLPCEKHKIVIGD